MSELIPDVDNATRNESPPAFARLPLVNPAVGRPTELASAPGHEPTYTAVCLVNENDFAATWDVMLTQLEASLVELLVQSRPPPTPEEARALLSTHFDIDVSVEAVCACAENLVNMGVCFLMPADNALGPAVLAAVHRLRDSLRASMFRSATRSLRSKLRRWKMERPYFADALAGVDINAVTANNLHGISVLTKEIARNRLVDILTPELKKRADVRWKSSSGTTGDRFQSAYVSFQRIDTSLEWMRLNRNTVYGGIVELTTPLCSGTECHMEMELPLQGRTEAPFGPNVALIHAFLNSGMNPCSFSDEKLEVMSRELDQLQPRRIDAALSYLAALAYWYRRNKRKPRLPIEAVWASYEVESEIHKRLISETFECPVYNVYGLTEAGRSLAIECESGHSLHFLPSTVIVEVLDSTGAPTKDGEIGYVHLTNLSNEALPIVRYRNRDLARARTWCRCGSPVPAFGLIEGREVDLITDTAGRVLTPRGVDQRVASVASAESGIGWYCLVQEADKRYRLMVRPEGLFSDAEERAVTNAVIELVGSDAVVTVERSLALRPSASGKFRLCHRTVSV